MKKYIPGQLVDVGLGFVHKCRIVSYPASDKIRFFDMEEKKYHTWNYHLFSISVVE